MNERGSHTLDLKGATTPDTPQRFCWWCLLLPIGLILWYIADALLGNKPTLPVPQPPQPRVGILQAIDTTGIENPITIVLSGANYEINYETVESLSEINQAAKQKDTFFVDLKNNTASGNLEKASTIIIVGSVKLSIGAIDENDILHADAFVHRNKINAYFNYAQSATGPPSERNGDVNKKRIIVVGNLINIDFPTTRGSSEANISVLELAPTKEELRAYAETVAHYEHSIEQRRESYRAAESRGSRSNHR